jgi:hypothetical protein
MVVIFLETVFLLFEAKEAMNGKEIEGRAITVHFSKSTGPRKRQTNDGSEENNEASPKQNRRKRNKRKFLQLSSFLLKVIQK